MDHASHSVLQVAIAMADASRSAIGSVDPEQALTGIFKPLVEAGCGDWIGISKIRSGGAYQALAPTSEIVRIVDELQYRHQQGPAILATESGELVLSTDVAADKRWPDWSAEAANAGINAALCTPLCSRGIRLGVLNVYSSHRRTYDPHVRDLIALAALHTSAILEHQQVADHLRRAKDSRTTIGQAQGILMARYQMTSEQTFTALRRYSQDSNTKLRDIAATVIHTRSLPVPSPPIVT